MKNLYIPLFLLSNFIFSINSYSQYGCGNGRYMSKVFTGFDLTSDIKFGYNYNLNGNIDSLKLDVYQPQGDTLSMRPLMILIHGGTFIGGSKTGADVKPLAEDFAKMGFVTSSINYRLGMQGIPFPGPDSSDATESVIRAVHDARAAVRFFKKDFSENGNTYKIDTNLIFILGVSAGAITAIHLAYLDEISEYPTYVDTTKLGLGGGIAGNSGNPGYSSAVKAIINSAGAVRDTSWIKPGNTPILSFHGTNDGTVPYGTDMISVSGIWQIMVVDGSASIEVRTGNLGVTSCLKTFPGADHTPHVGNAQYTDTLERYSSNFLKGFICNGAAIECSFDFVGLNEFVNNDDVVSVYPNPSNGTFNILLPEAENFKEVTFNMYNILGEKIYCQNLINHTTQINNEPLVPGMYLYVISRGNEPIGKGKLLVE